MTSKAAAIGDLFATCTGRLSATMEHQWLMSDPASAETARQRAAMIDLMEAVMGDDPDRMLQLRIEGKMAHAALLQRGYLNADAEDAAWAQRRSANEIGYCLHLMLGVPAETAVALDGGS